MADLEVNLPKAPELVIDLPTVPVLVIELPRPSVYFLPAGFIPPFIPETAAEASGEGTAIVRPIAVVVAVASGSGAGHVAPTGVARAVASGSGTAVVTAVAVFASAAVASGSGTAAVRPSAVVAIMAAGSGYAVAGVASAITAALASGVGSGVVRPSGVVQAQASGSGSAIVPAYELGAAYPTSIVASGEGTATVTAMAVYSTTAIAFGTGTAVVTPAVSVSGAASGSGTAVVAPRPVVQATASGSGTATVAAWTPFSAAGIDKASPDQTTTLSTYTEITGWQQRSGFTGSVFTSRGLILPAGVTVNIVSRCTRPATTAHASMTHRLLANGVVIINGTSNALTTQADGQFTTTAETLLTMESYTSNSSFSRLVVGSGTYITATLAP